jgi:Flp pilus assembly secretin CpaC
LNAGQTLALAGLLQVRTESLSIGIPGLAEVPYLGTFFRRNREEQNEIELLITVTPDFAGPMDPAQIPSNIPGASTVSPTDKELFFKGYLEVPADCPPIGYAQPATGMIDAPPASFSAGINTGAINRPSTISVGPNAPKLVDSPMIGSAFPNAQTANGNPGSYR